MAMTSRWLLCSAALGLAGCGGATTADDAATAGADAPAAAVAYTAYTEGTVPASVMFVDACAMGARAQVSMLDDSLSSDSTPITTPWPIRFWGGQYSTLRVSTNGWLSFSAFLTDSAPRRESGRAMLPSEGAPNAAIYALWEDLALRDDQSLCYATVGSAPNRTFVVEWSNVVFRTATAPDGELTFEVQLHEADDTIDLLYQTITAGADRDTRAMNATVGLENEERSGGGNPGTRAVTSTTIPETGTRIRFTPMR